MGFDDGSAQVRNIRDPGQPTAKEHRPRCGRAGDPTLKTTWRECLMCQWTMGFLEKGNRGSCESCAGHPGTETRDDVGYAGSEKGNGVSLDRKESSEVHRPTRAQQSHAQVRLKRRRERLHKLVNKGVRLCQRDRQWEKVSLTGSSSVRRDLWRTQKAALRHRIAVMTGGVLRRT